MSVTEDRLKAEYEAMQQFKSDIVTWEVLEWYKRPNCPSKYRFKYNLRSLIRQNNNQPAIVQRIWQIDVQLPHNYPWGKPRVSFFGDSIYHPNVWKNGDVCIEDTYWSGVGIPLDTLCEHIGQILAYQKHNVNSAACADKELIEWMSSHYHELPIDGRDIRRSRIIFR